MEQKLSRNKRSVTMAGKHAETSLKVSPTVLKEYQSLIFKSVPLSSSTREAWLSSNPGTSIMVCLVCLRRIWIRRQLLLFV